MHGTLLLEAVHLIMEPTEVFHKRTPRRAGYFKPIYSTSTGSTMTMRSSSDSLEFKREGAESPNNLLKLTVRLQSCNRIDGPSPLIPIDFGPGSLDTEQWRVHNRSRIEQRGEAKQKVQGRPIEGTTWFLWQRGGAIIGPLGKPALSLLKSVDLQTPL